MTDESLGPTTTNTSAPLVARDRIDLAASVASRVQICNIILADSHVSRTADAESRFSELVPNFRTVEARGVAVRESGRLAAFMQFEFSASAIGNGQSEEDGTKAAVPVRISAMYVVFYTAESLEGIDDEAIQAFASLNGVYNQRSARGLGFRCFSIAPLQVGQE